MLWKKNNAAKLQVNYFQKVAFLYQFIKTLELKFDMTVLQCRKICHVVVVDPFIFAFFVINETIFTKAYDLSL